MKVKVKSKNLPVILNLDHGKSFEDCKTCIDNGFTNVMIDASHLSFEDNIKLTKQVVDYAHSKNDTYSQIVHVGMLGTATTDYPASTTGVWPVNGMQYGNRGYDMHVGVNDNEALNKMPPYLAVYMWKRTA